MARHVSPGKATAQRALAVLATAGVALGAGTASAAAAGGSSLEAARTSPGKTDTGPGPQTTADTVRHVTGPATGLKPNPLAGTGSDPLDNGVGTQVADFKPVDSRALTGPVAQARSVGSVPVLDRVAG